jgi:hypothetical protein
MQNQIKEDKMKSVMLVIVAIVCFLIINCGYAQEQKSRWGNFEPKSESRAVQWSALGTLTPVAAAFFIPWGEHSQPRGWLVFGGLMIGPSLGYIYGDEVSRGLKGVGIRLGTTGLAFSPLFFNHDFDDDASWRLFAATMMIGSLAIIYSDVYDIANVRGVIAEHNRKFTSKSHTQIQIMPDYIAKRKAFGAKLTVKF